MTKPADSEQVPPERLRTRAWKALYSIDPKRASNDMSLQFVATLPKDYKPRVKNNFPLHEFIPWLPFSSVKNFVSVFYRQIPEGLIQIVFHPSIADKMMDTLKRSSDDVCEKIKSVVIHEKTEIKDLQDLHKEEIVSPETLTLYSLKEQSQMELDEFLSGFSSTIKDLGIGHVEADQVEKLCQVLPKVLPKLERLRLRTTSVSSLSSFLNSMSILQNLKLTHLVLYNSMIHRKLMDKLLNRLEEDHKDSLDYLQIGNIDGQSMDYDFTQIASVASKFYAQIYNAKMISLQPRSSSKNESKNETGIIWFRKENKDKKLDPLDEKNFFPESSSEGEHSAQLAVVSYSSGVTINGSAFIRPDGNLLQGYYTPEILAEHTNTITGI